MGRRSNMNYESDGGDIAGNRKKSTKVHRATRI